MAEMEEAFYVRGVCNGHTIRVLNIKLITETYAIKPLHDSFLFEHGAKET